jgi:plasmid stabilization system protein ParE
MSAPRPGLIIAPRAQRDFRSIRLYGLREWGTARADAYQAALVKGFERSRDYPPIGKARDDLEPGLRTWPAQHHVLFAPHRSRAGPQIDVGPRRDKPRWRVRCWLMTSLTNAPTVFVWRICPRPGRSKRRPYDPSNLSGRSTRRPVDAESLSVNAGRTLLSSGLSAEGCFAACRFLPRGVGDDCG